MSALTHVQEILRIPPESGSRADGMTPYLRDILATIGITDQTFITLEGLSRGPEAVAVALADARARLPR